MSLFCRILFFKQLESPFPESILRPDPQVTCTSEGSNPSTPGTALGTAGLRACVEEMGIGGNACRISVQASLTISAISAKHQRENKRFTFLDGKKCPLFNLGNNDR